MASPKIRFNRPRIFLVAAPDCPFSNRALRSVKSPAVIAAIGFAPNAGEDGCRSNRQTDNCARFQFLRRQVFRPPSSHVLPECCGDQFTIDLFSDVR
jgi:hypothetical protein